MVLLRKPAFVDTNTARDVKTSCQTYRVRFRQKMCLVRVRKTSCFLLKIPVNMADNVKTFCCFV